MRQRDRGHGAVPRERDGAAHQSILAPERCTTSAQRLISACWNVANCSGVNAGVSEPFWSQTCFISGEFSALVVSV
ncbi:hypothetical protein D3C85_1786720 [compost metagenome]